MNTTVLSALQARVARWRAQRWFRVGTDVALLIVVVTALGWWQTRGHVRGAAPSFALPALDGTTVTTASLQGQPTVLVFQAPWCTVCRAEVDNVVRASSWLSGRAHVVSIVAEARTDAEARRYVARNHLTGTVLLQGSDVARAFHVQAFPTTYFLDEHGNIAHSVVGYTSTFGLWWRALLS